MVFGKRYFCEKLFGLTSKCGSVWEVVVAQLAERSLTIPEDPGSNPVIGNFYLNIYFLLSVCRKDENKEKEADNGPFFNIQMWELTLPTQVDIDFL